MMTTIEAMKQALESAANYIDNLGGASKGYRMLLAEASASEEAQTAEAEPMIAPHITQAHFDRAFPGPAGERTELIDKVMEQAQVFASSWALVGSRFDRGDEIDNANEQKADLRKMVADMLAADAQQVADVNAQLAKLLGERQRAALVEKFGEPAQQVAVPQGWKLVPIEPTDEMCESCLQVHNSDDAKAAYTAMLAAAPRPPQGEVK